MSSSSYSATADAPADPRVFSGSTCARAPRDHYRETRDNTAQRAEITTAVHLHRPLLAVAAAQSCPRRKQRMWLHGGCAFGSLHHRGATMWSQGQPERIRAG